MRTSFEQLNELECFISAEGAPVGDVSDVASAVAEELERRFTPSCNDPAGELATQLRLAAWCAMLDSPEERQMTVARIESMLATANLLLQSSIPEAPRSRTRIPRSATVRRSIRANAITQPGFRVPRLTDDIEQDEETLVRKTKWDRATNRALKGS